MKKFSKKITPRGAGLVFGFIYFMGILFYDISIFSDIKYTLLAILIIYICGILDDIYTLSSKQKLLFIIIASVIVYFDGYQITNIGTFLMYL